MYVLDLPNVAIFDLSSFHGQNTFNIGKLF